MNGEVGNGKSETDVDEVDGEFAASPDDTVVITEDVDDLDDAGETTAELDVDALVAKIDKQSDAHKKEVKRRLEELAERKREQLELDSTFNFNLDDDI